MAAIEDMLVRTSTSYASWRVIPAEDKKYGPIAAITEISKCLGNGVDLGPIALGEGVLAEAQADLALESKPIAARRRRPRLDRLSGRPGSRQPCC